MLFTHWLIGGFFIFIGDLRLCHGTEFDSSSPASDELPTDVELEETHRLIQEGNNFIELGPQRDIVLLIGITCAGKSTLALLLSGDNRNLTGVESEPNSGKINIVDTNNRISSSTLLSQTIYPEKMIDSNDTVYYDCPGFSDTRSLAHEVTASHFIRRVIDYAERVKFLLVIGHDFLESRMTFSDLILHMASYIHNINIFRDGIALIVTKVKYSYYSDDNEELRVVSDEVEIKEIAKYLMSVKETIQDSKRNETHISEKNHKTYELATQYVDILLQKSGDKYTKIGIFRKPSKSGPLNSNKSIQKNKLSLRNLIENNMKFIVKNASDFTNYTVSERTRSSIEKSVENLNQLVHQVLKQMADRFSDFYEQHEHELSDVFEFTNEIRQHFGVWNSFQNKYGDNVIDFSNQLRTTIYQLNVTFCKENLQNMAKQTEYIDMWNAVMPDLALSFHTQAIIYKTILDPFQKRINETMRWYDRLLEFNQVLASYAVQTQRTQLVEMYGYRNKNRYNQLQAMQNSTQLDSDIVQNQIEELSVSTSDHRISLMHDIWDKNMQPVSKTFDSRTNTLRIHGFILKLSEVTEIINSNEYNAIKNYEIFALNTIFIDDDFRLTNNNNLVIIAPVWTVKGSRSINLNGKDAENYLEKPAYRTLDGLPGRAGQSAGNFLGIAFEIENSEMLSILAVGGRGGNGQNGALGQDGRNGYNGGFEISIANFLPIGFNTVRGEPGTSGTAGGNGGAGGYGGYCGDVQLVIESPKLSQSMISIPNCGAKGRGADGENGRGGHGGRGGQHSDTVEYMCALFVLCEKIGQYSKYVYASNGVGGVDGENKNYMETANVQTPVINKATAVNNYKLILRASLTEPEKHKNIQQIKKLHEELGNIQEITEFYAAQDLVDELIKLETQWQQFRSIDCIDLYESLLRRVQNYPGDGSEDDNATLTYLTTAIFTRIHNFRNKFENFLVIDIKKYLKQIAEDINDSFKQIRLTTAKYQESINDRIAEAQAFIAVLISDVSTRLEEMKGNIISSESELMELEQQATVKASKLKSKMNEMESKRETLAIFKVLSSITSVIFNVISFDQFLPKKETAEKEIKITKTEINNNDQLLYRTIENQQKFASKISPLLSELEKEIRGTNLNDRNKSQIGLDWKLTNVFKEIDHYLKQFSMESIKEIRLTVKKLEYATQLMIDINNRVQTYNQQSQLAVYLNEIASDSTRSYNNVLIELDNVIRTNLICTKYKQAINAVTLFAFPFADTYFADLQPRNLCDVDTFNVSSVNMLATAHTQIMELSNRIITLDLTVNARLDNHIHFASFNNKSVIGSFYQWSNADHRESIRKLLAGTEVVFTSEITKTDNWRMAVKFKEIGISIRTHTAEMQSDLDAVLDGYGMIMKHTGFSYYRWHDGIYVIASDTSVVIKTSFQECHNDTNSCYANEAYYKLRDGDAVLSPYTMWTLKLQRYIKAPLKFNNNLQRFADHVDIELEGTGTYVDADIKMDRNLMKIYYREYNVNNNLN